MEQYAGRDIFDFLTVGAAVTGVVLGLLNLWLYIDQRRVKLRVEPRWGHISRDGKRAGASREELYEGGAPAIKVVNMSAFPIEITEVGYRAERSWARQFYAWRSHEVVSLKDGGGWPRLLEVRESMLVMIGSTSDISPSVREAYALTACGTVRCGVVQCSTR
jgi:hypothetical protein